MKTRKELVKENAELKARLGAAAGETRKNLRARVARLAEENKTLQASVAAYTQSLNELEAHVKRIADALGTGEKGSALEQVARNAHTAEMELAKRIASEEDLDGSSHEGERGPA